MTSFAVGQLKSVDQKQKKRGSWHSKVRIPEFN